MIVLCYGVIYERAIEIQGPDRNTSMMGAVGVWIYACSHHYDGRGDSDKVIGGTDKRGGRAIWGRPGGGEGQMGLGEVEGSHEGRVGKMMGIRLVALRWVDTRRSGQNRFPVDDCGRTSFPG